MANANDVERPVGGTSLLGVDSAGLDGHDVAVKCGYPTTDGGTEDERDDGISHKR